jgi:pyruvate kinase
MNLRKTKIVCTIGPASSDINVLVKMIETGMDVARLNFSHGTHEQHKELIQTIREASEIAGKKIAILQDLQGPKIRTEQVENGCVILKDGDEFTITTDNIGFGTSQIVSTSYKDLPSDLSKGATLLLDDGYLILKVNSIQGNNIITTIIKGGELRNNKGIIAPGISFSAPSLSEKDLEDLKFGLSSDIDVVALSFVRSVRDILELKTTMKIFGRIVPIIAKIERPDAVLDIDNIIAEVDAIMVARGDLGLEMLPEQVPIIQKELIRKCNHFGKPVITATQMLESMIKNPRPSRAEASDVANAVIDGTDCVMLSGETSVGRYPIEAIDYMSKIIKNVENKYYTKEYGYSIFEAYTTEMSDSLGKAACIIADEINAVAIVTFTSSTTTAKNVAKYRPRVPIIGLTDDLRVHRRLNFVWGVRSVLVQTVENELLIPDSYIEDLLKLDFIKPDDNLVFVSGLSRGNIREQNMIKIFKVPNHDY